MCIVSVGVLTLSPDRVELQMKQMKMVWAFSPHPALQVATLSRCDSCSRCTPGLLDRVPVGSMRPELCGIHQDQRCTAAEMRANDRTCASTNTYWNATPLACVQVGYGHGVRRIAPTGTRAGAYFPPLVVAEA